MGIHPVYGAGNETKEWDSTNNSCKNIEEIEILRCNSNCKALREAENPSSEHQSVTTPCTQYVSRVMDIIMARARAWEDPRHNYGDATV